MDVPTSSERPVKLFTKDQKELIVSRGITKYSGCLTRMLDLCNSRDDSEFVGPVPIKVDAHTMKIIISWCENHERLVKLHPKGDSGGDEEPKGDSGGDEEMPQLRDYNSTFINGLDQAELFELTRAADFLEIIDLMAVATKKIASLMLGKTAVEIRKLFRIADDFSPEEKLEIAKRQSLFD